jgi:hypothetical protein
MNGRVTGSAGDDRLLEPDHRPGAVVAGDLEVVGGREAAVAGDHLDLALLGQAGKAVGEPADDRLLPVAELVEVDRGLAEGQAVLGHLLGLGDHPGRVQQGLGGDAADLEADPAEDRRAVHQHDRLAEVGGAEGGAVAAGPGPEHEHIGLDVGPDTLGGRRGGGRGLGGGGLDRRGGLLGHLLLGHLLLGGPAGGAGRLEGHEQVALGHLVPDPDPQLADRAGLGGRDVHGRLVGLEREDGVVDRHLVTGGDVHLDDGHAGEVADVGQADLDRRAHGQLLLGRSGATAAGGGRPRARCTAAG